MPELAGEWESVACELRPQGGPDGVGDWYLRRRVVFSGGEVRATFTNYAEAGCSTPILQIEFAGTVSVKGDSDVADGAKEVDLLIDRSLRLTPRQPQVAQLLGSAGRCGDSGWTVGIGQEVLETGCAALGIPPASPSREYEVLYVRDGMLYFGARPVDGQPLASEDKRPRALQVPLRRLAGGATRLVGQNDARVPTVVEVVRFRAREGVSAEAVAAMLHGYTGEMNKFGSLLYRTIAHSGGGEWTCLNYWASRSDKERLNADAQRWPSLARFRELVDTATLEIASFAIDAPQARQLALPRPGKDQ